MCCSWKHAAHVPLTSRAVVSTLEDVQRTHRQLRGDLSINVLRSHCERQQTAQIEARSALECVVGLSSDLQRGVQRTELHSWFEVRQRGCEKPSQGACLRGALVWIFALANAPTD